MGCMNMRERMFQQRRFPRKGGSDFWPHDEPAPNRYPSRDQTGVRGEQADEAAEELE